jgi:hypothetical protein
LVSVLDGSGSTDGSGSKPFWLATVSVRNVVMVPVPNGSGAQRFRFAMVWFAKFRFEAASVPLIAVRRVGSGPYHHIMVAVRASVAVAETMPVAEAVAVAVAVAVVIGCSSTKQVPPLEKVSSIWEFQVLEHALTARIVHRQHRYSVQIISF